MGIIRGFLLVVASLLLFLSLLASAFLWTLSSSLNYGTLEVQSVPVIKEILGSNVNQIIDDAYPTMQLYCQNNTEYVFSSEGYTFDIPCSVALQGRDVTIEEGVKDIVKGIYYDEYDCKFWDCLEKTELPVFLISQKAHNYWTSKLYISLAVLIAIVILIFFFIDKKTSLPITIGIPTALVGIIFTKIKVLFSLFPEQLSRLLEIFFSQSNSVAIKMIITGASLIVLGIILKILKTGFKLEKFALKLKEESKKEEIKKANPKKK